MENFNKCSIGRNYMSDIASKMGDFIGTLQGNLSTKCLCNSILNK